ncbi:LytR C-terminal domain-containing protein [Calidifontibacter sp. DB0510]|uniref:LytR C-terminal domain-containing protein n=1 Tax=Metallococcus carri TaxID=1656884 RepID=A0A967E9U8_9MICO|nr:LytR C-terminal domain-containing protein [Metallococcus carri]NHN56777.1 LytR C-terminal domain-containing protein [Metallococcus carri]NOP37846.1 LytR C-terminal domain-containing protein [Calidifontibacter sp. DB2511S]
MTSSSLRTAAAACAVAIVLPALAACGGDAKPTKTSSQVCPTSLPKPSMKIPLSLVYLNVYNASSTAGLASSASAELSWRGAHVLKTGNDPNPDERPTPRAAEIRYGKGGRQIALTLAGQVQNAVLYDDGRTNPTVDLVLGDSFKLVPLPPPPPAQVKVNVYNTTYRAGLSGQVAGLLKSRGFTIGRNGNDPLATFLPDDVAIIRYGEHGEPAARRVGLQLKGARLVKDGRKDTSVDLVLGNKYADLVPTAQATPTPVPSPTKPAGCK